MKDQRQHFFFWLGVFVLPLFWSWFTLAKSFTRRERVIAFLWLVVFSVWGFRQKMAIKDQVEVISLTYPAILGWITIALVVWFLFRIRIIPTIIEIIVLIDVVGMLGPSRLFIDLVGQPFDWQWLVPLVIVSLAHLVVEPLAQICSSREGSQKTEKL